MKASALNANLIMICEFDNLQFSQKTKTSFKYFSVIIMSRSRQNNFCKSFCMNQFFKFYVYCRKILVQELEFELGL